MHEIYLVVATIGLVLLSATLMILAALLIVYIYRRPLKINVRISHKKHIILVGVLVWGGTFLGGFSILIQNGLNLFLMGNLLIAGLIISLMFIGQLFYVQLLRAKSTDY